MGRMKPIAAVISSVSSQYLGRLTAVVPATGLLRDLCYASNFLTKIEALWPPKPKLLLIAYEISRDFGSFGV